MSQEPFEDHTRWRRAVSTLAFASLCLIPVAMAVGVLAIGGLGSPIGVLALLFGTAWLGLGGVMARVAFPVRASIHVDELGITVDGRRPLVLPWEAIRTIGVRRWRGREHVLLRPDHDFPLPDKLPPHVHLRPTQHVLVLELNDWRHPDDLRTALRACAGDRWDRPRQLPPR